MYGPPFYYGFNSPDAPDPEVWEEELASLDVNEPIPPELEEMLPPDE